jgi:hypothetical protein
MPYHLSAQSRHTPTGQRMYNRNNID